MGSSRVHRERSRVLISYRIVVYMYTRLAAESDFRPPPSFRFFSEFRAHDSSSSKLTPNPTPPDCWLRRTAGDTPRPPPLRVGFRVNINPATIGDARRYFGPTSISRHLSYMRALCIRHAIRRRVWGKRACWSIRVPSGVFRVSKLRNPSILREPSFFPFVSFQNARFSTLNVTPRSESFEERVRRSIENRARIVYARVQPNQKRSSLMVFAKRPWHFDRFGFASGDVRTNEINYTSARWQLFQKVTEISAKVFKYFLIVWDSSLRSKYSGRLRRERTRLSFNISNKMSCTTRHFLWYVFQNT